MKKRIFTLVLALAMIFACSATVFAAEVSSGNSDSISNVMPRMDFNVSHYYELSSLSKTMDSFRVISAFGKVKLNVNITVDQPCTLYIFLYDNNGNSLGASSLTITQKGTFNFTPSPASLGKGDYYLGYYFDKANVRYTLIFSPA